MQKIFFALFVVAVFVVSAYFYFGSSALQNLSGGINADIDRALLSAPFDASEFGAGATTLHDGRSTTMTSSDPGRVVADISLLKPRAIVVKGNDADVYAVISIKDGGTGIFIYLVQYEYSGAAKTLIEVDKVLLGDRVLVDDISTEITSPTEYIVTVALKERKLGEAMTIEPSQSRLIHLKRGANGLEVSAITFGTAEDGVVLVSPLPGAEIAGPVFNIVGAARGLWYFEASFPVELRADDGEVLATAVAQAQGDWMTAKLVPFTAAMVAPNTAHGRHILVLKKDNPSGLPENDRSVEIPIVLK